MYTFRNRNNLMWKFGILAALLSLSIFVRYVTVIIYITVKAEIPLDNNRLLLRYFVSLSVHLYNLACKVFLRSFCRSFVKRIFNFFLQSADKCFIAIACNNSKHVHVVDFYPVNGTVYSIARTVNTKSHTAPHFLALAHFAIRLF